ncbi:MAG: NAD(P)/FAD-dependent oxidoreductase [Candidatus Omnitrophica bacterium]|nr:NAD(P)/FAD-dependent oxidoreductase [Candidatus Omnitrophota bacterium]
MENITVIGAGLSGLAFTEKLRAGNPTLKITLIDKNKYYFSRLEVITHPGDISRRIDLAEWANKLNIEFIQAQVERINPNRKRIFFKKAEPCEYEAVVLATGLKSRKIEVKGDHREGFFYLSQIDPLKLKDLLRISHEATVCVSSWLGIRLVISLINLGKEVNLVADNLDFLNGHKEKLIELLEAKKVKFYLGVNIEEAVGEGMVKAVKILPLKVFSSQLVFIDSGFIANHDFFEEEIVIVNNFLTKYKSLYFLGDVLRKGINQEHFFVHDQDNVRDEAQALSNFILKGEEIVFKERLIDDLEETAAIDKFMSELGVAQTEDIKNL